MNRYGDKWEKQQQQNQQQAGFAFCHPIATASVVMFFSFQVTFEQMQKYDAHSLNEI